MARRRSLARESCVDRRRPGPDDGVTRRVARAQRGSSTTTGISRDVRLVPGEPGVLGLLPLPDRRALVPCDDPGAGTRSMADTKQTKSIGEHYVCAMLARCGWAPALTRDGSPG